MLLPKPLILLWQHKQEVKRKQAQAVQEAKIEDPDPVPEHPEHKEHEEPEVCLNRIFIS